MLIYKVMSTILVTVEIVEIESFGSWGVFYKKEYSSKDVSEKKYLELTENITPPDECKFIYHFKTIME